MPGVTNIVVCKNTLHNIIANDPNGDHVRDDFFRDKGGTEKVFGKEQVIEIINDAVFRTNNIVFHTYNFIKLYILYRHYSNDEFPLIDKDFVCIVMGIVSIRKDKRGRKASEEKQKNIDELIQFYEYYYQKYITDDDIVEDDKLSYILKCYESVDIVKNINVNISEHFFSHIRKYVNIRFEIKEQKKAISDASLSDEEKKTQIKALNTRFNNIKYDILSTEKDYKCDKKDRKYVNEIRKLFIPKGEFEKNSIPYDIKVTPQRYLKSMIMINEKIQELGTERDCEYKLFHALPLRTSIVPRYITIDTATIVSLFLKTPGEYLKDLSDLSDIIWSSVFNLEESLFKRSSCKFNYMIKTDGVGCSILFERLTKKELESGKLTEAVARGGIKRKVRNREKRDIDKYDYEYIEDASFTKEEKKKNFVYIDPGHNDLINCLGTKLTDEGDEVKFRYTRKQRNEETRKNKYKQIMEKLKSDEVKKQETKMSNYNSRTCDAELFEKYLMEKIKLNRKLSEHYRQKVYRKLKFNLYTNMRKSESKMMHNFLKKYGPPKDVIVVFGDYSKKKTMKGSEPHISKRIKKVMVDSGYKVKLINEYNTSKLCNKCSCVTKNETKKVKGKVVPIWKLLRCTSEKCLTYHNRDENACRNMRKINKSILSGKGRPIKYTPVS